MRIHERTQQVATARAAIELELLKLQEQHGLTDIEMLQALNSCESTILKFMLRAEWHPEDPGKKADEA